MRGFAKGGPLPLFLRALREADLGGDERAGIGGERAVAEIVGRPPAAHEHQGKRGDEQPAHQKPSGSASRSEEHTSELQSLMRISYAVFCLKKKQKQQHKQNTT